MAEKHGALGAYARYFESLTPESLPGLGALVTDDIHFRDPFNDVRGRDALIHIFEHMFRTTQNAKFTVLRIAADEAGGILEWVFDFEVRGRAMHIAGTSVVTLSEDGRVAAHIDHWDVAGQLYATLPLIGPVIRWITGRFSA